MQETEIQPPSWLNKTKKIVEEKNEIELLDLPTKDQKIFKFISDCFISLFSIRPELDNEQAVGIIANSVVESGYGLKHRGKNLGGWKINEQYCKNYKKEHNGVDPFWWERAGHLEAGDPPMCYYRVYSSYDNFFKEWLERFVPNTTDQTHRYYKTGLEFNNNFREPYAWFKEMVKAGYKGPVRAQNPDPSIHTFMGVVESVKRRLAQGYLRVEPDGVWGNGSKQAANNKSVQEIFDIAANSLRTKD